jgi:predicted ATP-dependent protease
MAEDQTKLSTQFGVLADIVREANYWAEQGGSTQITAGHVRTALDQRVYRNNLVQERLREMIARDMLLIDVEGRRVGQINGLSVIRLGDHDFGQPNRITASVEPGRAGVIDIEREVELSGPIHSKGVLILSGYLADTYGRNRPVALSARLAFEQSYTAVEGDSASCAELYALLSALADLPLAQSIAVTGSVNQRGEVQVIGGLNEKIEGFFDVCCAKGLNRRQGVILPVGNAQNLMLRQDVVDCVDRGEFHLWPVRTVDEGMEILTGIAAGERGPDGAYPPDSVHGRVEARLDEIARHLIRFGREFARDPSRDLSQETQE